MAPPIQPLKTPKETLIQGNCLLTNWFKTKKKRGRPKKKKAQIPSDRISISATTNATANASSRNKAPPVSSNSTRKAPPASCVAEAPSTPAAKKPRTNWSKDANAERLRRAAVGDYLGKRGDYLDGNGKPLALAAFAHTVDIPYNTLKHYVCADARKRRSLGKSVGRSPLLSSEDQDFVADVLARKDRGNEGANSAEAVDLVLELKPDLSRLQATQHLHRTLLRNHPDQVKAKLTVVQPTTTKRSAITVSEAAPYLSPTHTMDLTNEKKTVEAPAGTQPRAAK